MAKLTMVIGFVLLALGVCLWLATGHIDRPLLTPAWFGLLLMMCGALARTTNLKKRMMYMHVAVAIGLIGLLSAVVKVWRIHAAGAQSVNPAAYNEQVVMAFLCFVFVVMCVRSFLAARRTPALPEAAA